jgi:hypothetical protein
MTPGATATGDAACMAPPLRIGEGGRLAGEGESGDAESPLRRTLGRARA